MSFLYVFLGGGIGACLRYATSLGMLRFDLALWQGTLLCNLFGTLVLFLSYYFIPTDTWHSDLLRVGILGSLTTFSTFSMEFMTAFQNQQFTVATLILGLNLGCAFILGLLLVR